MTETRTPSPSTVAGGGPSGVPVKSEATTWDGVMQLAIDMPPVAPQNPPRALRVATVAVPYPEQVLEAVRPVWRPLTQQYSGRRLYVAWARQCRGPLARWSRVKLTAEERRPVSRALAAEGMSARGIATLLGMGSDQTIRADLGQSVKRPAPTAHDTHCRTCGSALASPELREAASLTGNMTVKTSRVLEMLRLVPAGFTTQELEWATGWHHGIASGTCTRLGERGMVACSVTRREGRIVYVLAT